MDPIQTQPQQSQNKPLIVAGLAIVAIATVGYSIWMYMGQTVYAPSTNLQAQQPAPVQIAEDSTAAISNDLNTKTNLANTDQEFNDIDQDLKNLQ